MPKSTTLAMHHLVKDAAQRVTIMNNQVAGRLQAVGQVPELHQEPDMIVLPSQDRQHPVADQVIEDGVILPQLTDQSAGISQSQTLIELRCPVHFQHHHFCKSPHRMNLASGRTARQA